MLGNVKGVLKDLVEIALVLVALGIVLGILFANVPFLGKGIVQNLLDLVKQLGDAGLIGLITLGVILWVFNKK